MKNIARTALLGFSIAACFATAAQINPIPEALLDGGFESANTDHFWDRSNDYIGYLGLSNDWEVPLGSRTQTHVHSGAWAWDMGVANPGQGEEFHAEMIQQFATPLKVDDVSSASVWVYSAGQQLECYVIYAYGAPTHMQQTFSGNTWTKWNVATQLVPGRAIKSIAFVADTTNYGPVNRIIIDDASIVKKVKFGF